MELLEALTRFFKRHRFFSHRSGLPKRIDFPFLSESWDVEYRLTSRRGVMARPASSGRLVVTGWIGDEERCRLALQRWLVRYARMHLLPRLAELSEQTGWYYRTVSVRNQRARWGVVRRLGTSV